MKKISPNTRVEIAITFLAILFGVILIFSGLRQAVFNAWQSGTALMWGWIQSLVDGLIVYWSKFTLFDFLGWLLILGAIIFSISKVRTHFQDRPDYEATDCPRCGSDIHRVHRSSWDRLLGRTMLPNSRRYQCVNHECGWNGLRRKRHRSESGFPDRVVVKE